MDKLHSLLKRQIKRYLDDNQGVDASELEGFLQSINEAYKQFDEDRKMLERSLDISSQELLQANSELRALFHALPDSIFVIDEKGTVLDAKGCMEDDRLIIRDKFLNKCFYEVWDKETNKKFKTAINDTLERRIVNSLDYEIVSRDQRKFFEATILPLIERQMLVVLRDITSRVEAQLELQANLESIKKINLYESIINDIALLINKSDDLDEIFSSAVKAIHDKLDAVDYVSIYTLNDDSADMIASRGYPKWFLKQLSSIPSPKGATWQCLNSKESILVTDTNDDKYLGNAAHKLGVKSYATSPIIINSVSIGCIHIQSKSTSGIKQEELSFLDALARLMGSVIDKATSAKALKTSEERYRVLFDQAPYGICLINHDFVITHCNPMLVDIFQSTPEKVIGLDLTKLNDKTFLPVVKRAFQGEIVKHDSIYTASTSSVEVWLSVKCVPIYDNEGNVHTVMGVVEDITARKENEEALLESIERFKSLVDNSSDLVFESSFDGKFLYVSPNFEKILGYKPEDLIGKSIFENIHPDDLAPAIKEFSQAIELLGTGGLEHRYKNKDGEWRTLYSSGSTFNTAKGEIRAVVTSHDITDKKKMEEELGKSQRLESLGVLAGGIAHDFNNLLAIIMGNISLAEMFAETNDPRIKDILSQAHNASSRAGDLVDQLRTFAKGGSLKKQTISLSELLMESTSFALRGSNIKCEYDFTDDLDYVDVDEGQINQVINNLVINAKQAMPGGGLIRVGIDRDVLDQGNKLNLSGGEYVKFVFEDSGEGISPEVLDKIFDPFFTTKESGSGLGLATSYSIISKHGGGIFVDSEINRGTKFEIYLPSSEKDHLEAREEAGKRYEFAGSVLVMDDEEGIRKTLERMLEACGFSVDCVENEQKAIQKYSEAHQKETPYNLVILDLTIPGEMGALRTLDEIRKVNQSVKAIITSGHTKSPVVSDYKSYGFKSYLKKPFSLTELQETVSKALSS